jgi:hypothetical protein
MRRALVVLATILVASLGVLLISSTLEVRRHASIDQPRPADVIVILGAAEYRGRPSPVLKARLDHGLELWQRKLAPRILTTGGAGGDPIFTEGEVGRDYLIQHGVPPEAVIVEPEGSSTAQSTAAAGEILRRMGRLRSGHRRLPHVPGQKMLEARGLKVYGSPRPSANRDGWRLWWLCSRQAMATCSGARHRYSTRTPHACQQHTNEPVQRRDTNPGADDPRADVADFLHRAG